MSTMLLAPAGTWGATTGFDQTSGGPWDYNTPANWVDGTINGIWDSSLTLSGDQTVTFGADTALGTGLTFNYAGNKSETLRGTGGNFTLTLGGDVDFTPASTTSLTFGSTSANQNLNLELGGATRTFTVTGQGNGANFGRGIYLINSVSNGGINLSGAGTGGGKLSLRNSTNSLTSMGVAGAELEIYGANNSATNTVDTVSGALSINPGVAMITLTPRSTKNTLLQAGSFTMNGGVVLFRGTNLGVNTIASATPNSTNVAFTSAPALLGGAGTAGQSTIGILPGAIGDTSNTGSGLGATGGLVTYDAARGVRLLDTGTEYTAGITDHQTQLDNVRYASTGSVQTTALSAGTTTINSLSFAVTGTSGTQGMVITGDEGSTLKLNSGVIYASQNVTASGNSASGDAMLIDVPTLDLNGKEGYVFVSTKNNSGGTVTSNGLLRISSAITNASGLTLASDGVTRSYMQITGDTANTYSGVTTINGASVRLGKSIANAAIPGDLVINAGNVYDAGDQIADLSNVTINGGILFYNPSNNSGSSANETFASLTMTGGATSPGSADHQNVTITGAMNLSGGVTASYTGGHLNVGGVATLSGGTLTVGQARGANTFDGVTSLNGGLAISNTARGAYMPISINAGSDATHFGGKLVLGGDVSFTGNGTNANTVTIDAPAGTSQGVVALDGTRSFDIGNGAAAADLTIVAPIMDGDTAGGITKTGAGTLALLGNNSYSGATTLNGGTFLVNGATSGQGNYVVNASATLGGSGTIGLGSGNSVSVASAGHLSPGNSPGILSVSGSQSSTPTGGDATVNLVAGSNFDVDLAGLTAGTEYDQLNLIGTIDLGGATLNVNRSFGLAANEFFTIVANDGSDSILGTFAGLTEGSTVLSDSGYNLLISYTGENNSLSGTGNDVVLYTQAVPEPGVLGLMGVIGLGVLRRRRRGGAAAAA